MVFMKNCLASIFMWLVAWKRGLPRPNISYECLSPSHNLSYTITKLKVIVGSEAPEYPLRVLFRFLRDRVLLRVLSDRILCESSVIGSYSGSSVTNSSLGSSVLFFRHATIFYQKVLILFFIKKQMFCFTLYFQKELHT